MSQIQWTQQTWNPILGCTQVIIGNPALSGCLHCYAMRQAYRNQAMGLRGYQGVVKKTSQNNIVWTGKVNLVPEALLKPLERQKPTTWFVNSMSDLFHESVPFEWINLVFGIMALCQQHTFQVLTKRPLRMLEWSEQTHRDDWCNALVHYAPSGISKLVTDTTNTRDLGKNNSPPNSLLDVAIRYPGFPLPNVWLGVSVESQLSADERIPLLLETPAALRFLSCEPLLESVDLTTLRCLNGGLTQPDVGFNPGQPLGTFNALRAGISWGIVGGESGYNARPCSLDWIHHLVAQFKAAGIPIFVKQLGTAWAKSSGTYHIHSKGGDPNVWTPDLRIREFPVAERSPTWDAELI